VTRKIAALAALVALAAALVTACGGTGQDSHARSLYHADRAAEDSRTDAEEELRAAFSDISTAAQAEDRAAVLAAARRGQKAAADIDSLLATELEAARGLAAIEKVSADAKRLTEGLQQSRDSLALVMKELEIALDDPFLAHRAKEVNDLAKESTDVAVKGELAVRRADRALALALGLEPRLDQLFTTTG
jgi:hypothetical protein